MTHLHHTSVFFNDRGGIAFILIAVMVVALGMGAFLLDLGRGWDTNQELAIIADSAALAGGKALGGIYIGLTPANQQNYNPGLADTDLIQTTARDATTNLLVEGMPFNNPGLRLQDIQIGRWAPPTFIPFASPPNAVQVLARKDDVANNPLVTFFSGIFGINGFSVTSSSVAALTPLSYVPPSNPPPNVTPGRLILPIAIDQGHDSFIGGCNPNVIPINLTLGAGASCTAWHTFEGNPENLVEDFQSVLNGQITSPETYASQGTNYTFGGDPVFLQANSFGDLFTLATTVTPPNTAAPLLVPVYANNNCNAPTAGEQIEIVGFATFTMFLGPNPDDPANGIIGLLPQCNVYNVGRSGSPNNNFGTFGSVPVLVQ
jgi:hypothetical protein